MSQPETEAQTIFNALADGHWLNNVTAGGSIEILNLIRAALASRAPATTPTPLEVKVINSVRTWSMALDPQVVQAEIDMAEAIREYDAQAAAPATTPTPEDYVEYANYVAASVARDKMPMTFESWITGRNG